MCTDYIANKSTTPKAKVVWQKLVNLVTRDEIQHHVWETITHNGLIQRTQKKKKKQASSSQRRSDSS